MMKAESKRGPKSGMGKPDIGQAIQILANVGVIAGIGFLAIELAQNNDLLEAEARARQLDSRVAYAVQVLDDADIGTISYKAETGQQLSGEEEYYWRLFAIYNFIQWEWQHREYDTGTLAEEELPIEGWRSVVRDLDGDMFPIWVDAWGGYRQRGAISPEYVTFMNENVISE